MIYLFVFSSLIPKVLWLSDKEKDTFLHTKKSACPENKVVACVCVFIFFHCEGFFHLQDVEDILEGTDQRSCVVNIS